MYRKHKLSARIRYKKKLKKRIESKKNFQIGRAKTVKFDINKSDINDESNFTSEQKKGTEGVSDLRFSEVDDPSRYSNPPSPRANRMDIEEEIPTWEKLTLNDKAKLFSYWVLVMMLSNVFVFIGCWLMIF